MNGPGFVFWGLFAVFGVLVGAYLLWMRRADRQDSSPAGDPASGDDREETG